ncbi:MAG: MgtC/SapB family protein [Sediminibacterium sp.]|nr:MgtC/SapB family protein [Sediminibacterium sp.]MBX9780263.1 MgtC/SapB family protein [Chitinophagaceae bacterium]
MKDTIFSQETGYILLALFIGLLIGVEREYKNKAAGLRTLMLVTTGSCIFTIISMQIGIANPDRLAANIVTGIGFLGAGAIFKDDNRINGLTTATTIWICAALGMAVGAGLIKVAILGTTIVIMVLSVLKYAEAYIDKQNRTRSYKISAYYTEEIMDELNRCIQAHKLKTSNTTVQKDKEILTVGFKITGKAEHHKILQKQLFQDNRIIQVDYQ